MGYWRGRRQEVALQELCFMSTSWDLIFFLSFFSYKCPALGAKMNCLSHGIPNYSAVKENDCISR